MKDSPTLENEAVDPSIWNFGKDVFHLLELSTPCYVYCDSFLTYGEIQLAS